MDENRNHPVRKLTDLLADLIIQQVETERQLKEANKNSDDWYQNWQRKDSQLKETEAKLATEIEEHQRTREALREALETAQKKGATNNG